MKQTLIIIGIVVAIIAGAVVLGNNEDSSQVGATGSNNWYGQENGIITVTEYGDFQCPACAQFYPIVSQVKEQYKDQIRFEFKHFPLVQIHPNATAAHRAAQAAANQGKFWEMHDLLYENQSSWQSSTSPSSIFESYAQQLSLDMEKYKSDVNASETLSIINADIDAGKNVSVTGTPTFFIDGVKIEDSSTIASVDGFSKVIQDAINAKNQPTN